MASIDLVKYGKNIDLPFGFCNIRIISKKMTVTWSEPFVASCQHKGFEQNMKRSTSSVSTAWKTSYTKTFAQSTLGSLIQKPNPAVVQTLNDKTMALKMMSLDMSSSSRVNKGQPASSQSKRPLPREEW